MFASKQKQSRTEHAVTESKNNTTIPSVIAEGIEIGGELTAIGDLQLDGNFIGTVKCNAFTIGETGHFEGKVEAEHLTVMGYMKGEVFSKKVSLKGTANVIGNVYHDILEVEAGAEVEGNYTRKMPSDADQESAAPVSLTAVTDKQAVAE